MNDSKNLIEKYLKIKEQTYGVIEGPFIERLKTLIPNDLTLKDVTVLYLIEEKTQLENNTSSNIAIAANMAFNTFSNRLKKLEKDGLIQREKKPLNKREHFITLTLEGKKIYDYYLKELNALVLYLQNEITGFKKITLYKAILKTSTYLNEKNHYPLFSKLFNIKETLNHALTDIYNGIYLTEQVFLDEKLPEISLKEMRILIEIYLLSESSMAMPKSIHESLNIPYSSITHTLNKCESLKIIKRIQNPLDKRSFILNLTKKHKKYIESFMNLRINMYQSIKKHLSSSEWDITLKAFELIGHYSVQQ
jgi:DNA-binding MarR family transcriptional regulator